MEEQELKIGDIVLVDIDRPNGGYEATIVSCQKQYFATIRAGEHTWSIMKDRLTKKSDHTTNQI